MEENTIRLLDVLSICFSSNQMYVEGRPFYALSYRMHGNTTVTINGEAYHLGDDTLAFFPPDVSYTRNSDYDEMIVIHFMTEKPLNLPFLFPYINKLKMRSYFKEAFSLFSRHTVVSYYRAVSVLYLILSELIEAAEPNIPPMKQKIEQYFLQCFAGQDMSVGKAAADLFVSENYLRLLVRRYFGLSPKDYINRLRMEYAKSLIRSGYFKVGHIAEMCGFSDGKNFATAFKKYFGVSPTQMK